MNYMVYTILAATMPLLMFTLSYVRELREDTKAIKKHLGIVEKKR